MSRKRVAEEGYQVPIWVITFSDMTTNLLTFFVLLLSMGHVRDETLFDQGQALTFLKSVKQGFGFKGGIDFENVRIKYHITGPGDLSEGRTIDAKEEDIRRVFQNLSRSMKTMPSQIVAEKTNFSVTNIRFDAGEAVLNEPAKRFLREFSAQLQQTVDFRSVRLYVLGLANDQVDEKEQWILSAKRASAVAEFLEHALPATAKRPIYSWGAGTGGDWVGQDSPISKQSQIYFAVIQPSTN